MATQFRDILELNRKLNNFDYGLVINGVYDKWRNTTAADWDRYFRLATPQEFAQRRVGTCWDYTTFEAQYFKDHFPDIPWKAWYIVFDDRADMPTHTFITFQYGNNYYWFESSFKKFCGVWKASSEADIVNAVMTGMDDHDRKKLGRSLIVLPYYVFNYDASSPKLYHTTCEQFMHLVEQNQIPHRYSRNYHVEKTFLGKESTTMTKDTLMLTIHESAFSGIIDQETSFEMLQLVEEASSSNKMDAKLRKLKAIKDARPGEYDGPEEVKKFVDKYYNDIVKCAKIAEKEPSEIKETEIRTLSHTLTGVVIAAVVLFSSGVAMAGVAFGLMIFYILSGLTTALSTIVKRKNVNSDVVSDLSKIKKSLKRIDASKLDKESQKKLSKMITSIEDAEVESDRKEKVRKESVDLKLKVYDACMMGEITESERDMLLMEIEGRI